MHAPHASCAENLQLAMLALTASTASTTAPASTTATVSAASTDLPVTHRADRRFSRHDLDKLRADISLQRTLHDLAHVAWRDPKHL